MESMSTRQGKQEVRERDQKMEEQQSSPGTRPVGLKDCIEELVKFVLESHINQTLGLDLGLSSDFCSDLLLMKVQPNQYDDPLLPPDPPYKRLASALYEYVTSCAAAACNDLKRRGQWNEVVVVDEAIALVNMLKTVCFELHVQEPFFTQLKDGLKTVEGRCALGDYNRIGSGAMILFNKCVLLQVQDVHRYASFSEMLKAENLEKVLPGVRTIDEGVGLYRKFYTEDKERFNGVLAICVSKSADQPYISMARILSVSAQTVPVLFDMTSQLQTTL